MSTDASTAAPNWEAVCEIEPGLRYFEHLAEATAAAGAVPASWTFFRKALMKLVGLYATWPEFRAIEWRRSAHLSKALLGKSR